MAAEDQEQEETKKLLSLYIGISFSLFLTTFPKNYSSLSTLVPTLESQVKELKARLVTAEEQLKQMKSRRKEDSKANARVVEIFASHRNAWQAEERRLLQQIEETAGLRSRMEEIERDNMELKKRNLELEEMIGFMSRRDCGEFEEEEEEEVVEQERLGGCGSREFCGGNEDDGHDCNFEFSSEFLASAASKFWAERATHWQDVQYESLESVYHMKHFVARRESPWKVDGESTGISSKLKLLEEELMNLETVGKPDLSKVPSSMRKQAKRYQALAGKIDDLCSRMQASDPCESTLSAEFRTQRQTEFLLEAFRLQQRASETGQKLLALQTELGKTYYTDEVGREAKASTRRSLDSIRNNLKQVQRNLEIWLARIIGDLEGILARDGASRIRESGYYISRWDGWASTVMASIT